MPNILIADDHSIVRFGTMLMIKQFMPNAQILGAESLNSALKYLNSQEFNLLILDVNLPGGNNIQMIDVVKLRQPHIKILIFSAYDEQLFALRYIQAGADGYLPKQLHENELKTAIQTVLNDEKYISPSLKERLLNGVTGRSEPMIANPLNKLSNRETEVMQLLIKGLSLADISTTLNIEVSTVSTYKSRIYEKLQVVNIIDLAEKARIYNAE